VTEEESEKDLQNGKNRLWSSISNLVVRIRVYMRLTRAPKILRRYFAMNAFDGAMTSMGVVIGASLTHINNPATVMGVIVVGGIAMAISGFSGTYMAESAERNNSLNELEDAMLVDLDETIYGKASRVVSILAALVDGSAPFLASIPAIIPFFAAEVGLISTGIAYQISVFLTLCTLFMLGVFLGRISKKNIYFSGFKMTLAGLAVAIIAVILNNH
jgi:predicted membrane protein (TIGR00267 family)